jgi:hypothetical protein
MNIRFTPLAAAIALGVVATLAYASSRIAMRPSLPAAVSVAQAILPAATTRPSSSGYEVAGDPHGNPSAKKPKGPTADEVGDVDSFGRNVRWLGLTAAAVYASPDCAAYLAEDPTINCAQINDVSATTSYAFNDIAHISLPAGATNSLLCYWFSPRVVARFDNPGAAAAVGRYAYNPTLTVENPVLSTPGLIDPTTGAPFAGQLLTSMSASESVQMVVQPGLPFTQSLRDSAVCQAGLISRSQLMSTYGLTSSQADDFFNSPTTVRLNVAGSSRLVSDMSFSFGLRIVGD